MSDYGRYSGIGSATRGRDRERDRDFDRDFDRERERGRGGFFGLGRDDDRGGRRERGGFFGGGRDEERRPRGERGGLGRDDGRSSAYDRNSRHGRDWDSDERYYGYDDYHEGLPIDETGRLIASNKVEGTPVYGRGGDRLGSIYNFMVDKRSGQVEYAVMSYGGFLGMGQRYYPLPWRILSYDTREGGYRLDMSERDLERAPSFDRDDEPRFSRDYGRRVNSWYGLDR